MKILVISQYFYPENFRINHLVLELKKRGHEISVLTGKPNYPKGEYFKGYTFRGNESESWNGIDIIRVPLRERKKNSISLVRNYGSFVYHANRKVNKLNYTYDLIYVFEVSPITVAIPAIKYKKQKNIPIIMNVQDLWPENIQAITGVNNGLFNYFLDKLVNYIYRNVDLILTASPAFNEKIKKRVDKPNKIIYWPQYSVVHKKNALNNINIFNKDDFNIVFTGNVAEAQGLEIVIESAKMLIDTSIVFHIIGEGRRKKNLVKMVEFNQLEKKVVFYEKVAENKVPDILVHADMALLCLKPNDVFDMTIPAKLQTYLACGCPVLGCVQGISKKIIDDNELGVTVKRVDSESLVQLCREVIQNKEKMNLYSYNAIKYSENNFNMRVLIDQLEKYMEKSMQQEFTDKLI